MGVFDLFRPQPQQQQAPQQQAATPPQGAMPAQSGVNMQQNNPGAGAGTGLPGTQPLAPSSPLDAFADLWKNDPTTTGNQPSDPFSQPLFNTDPAKIIEAAGKADFLSQIPQELMQKAMAGNDPQAFMQVINAVGQQSLALALQLSTATVEQAGSKIGERFNKSIPDRFKDMQINNLQPTNPVLSHPAAEPMLKNLRDQVRRQEPNLRPDEVNQKAERYLMAFANQLSDSGKPTEAAGGNPGNEDWEAWATQSRL